FNEDGLPDLATANWEDGTVEVFLNQGGRAFAPRQIIDTQFPHGNHGEDDAIRLVDINGDSHIDILAGAVNGSWLTTHLGYGNGTFAGPTWFLTDHVFSIAAGNFDSDNDL